MRGSQRGIPSNGPLLDRILAKQSKGMIRNYLFIIQSSKAMQITANGFCHINKEQKARWVDGGQRRGNITVLSTSRPLGCETKRPHMKAIAR